MQVIAEYRFLQMLANIFQRPFAFLKLLAHNEHMKLSYYPALRNLFNFDCMPYSRIGEIRCWSAGKISKKFFKIINILDIIFLSILLEFCHFTEYVTNTVLKITYD